MYPFFVVSCFAAFVDVSAGFDSVTHTKMMRKLELIGYDNGALKWLSDYPTDRCQYVGVEAKKGLICQREPHKEVH